MRRNAGHRHPDLKNAVAIVLVAAGAFSGPAFGAAGDLDPGFGNMGRFAPSTGFPGQAWSVEPDGGGGWIFAGGYQRLRLNIDDPRQSTMTFRGYISRLRGDGTVDDAFMAPLSISALPYDTAVQPDGRIVVVGSGTWSTDSSRSVWRFESNGALGEGLVGVGFSGGAGYSVVLEPDGRIVAAGSSEGSLRVWRLLPNGERDASFADAGVFVGPASTSGGVLLRAGNGDYRVLMHDTSAVPTRCSVLGLDASGQVDESFGDAGVAPIRTQDGAEVACRSMALAPEGGWLVAGRGNGRAFVRRLTPAGAADPGFDAPSLADLMDEARAIGVDAAGRIVVAGQAPAGMAGARVARLHSNGGLDTGFGNAGSTWIDLPNEGSGYALVNDLHVSAAGSLVVAGARLPFSLQSDGAPFVARLLGDGAGGGPGVLGFERPKVAATEAGGTVSLTVRRMGGRRGAIDVAYRTRTAGSDLFSAVAGEDYWAASGQLYWADGDGSDRHIVVSIAADSGSPEEEESFQLELDAPAGGAALGTRVATVAIAADGAPAGSFSLDVVNAAVAEDWGTTQVAVSRNYYSAGAVSVALKLVSGTAMAGVDFAADPLTVQWADGEAGTKYVDVRILDDAAREPAEQFTVKLAGATGGAVVGPRSSATITIGENDETPPAGNPPPPEDRGSQSSGGGGSFGWLALLLLAGAHRGRIRRA